MTTTESISFGRRFAVLARERPDAPFCTLSERTLTRAEFDELSTTMARSLRSRGVRVGDLITISLPNSIEFMLVAAACWKVGATPQPVSYRLPAPELEAIARLAESPFMVAEKLIITTIATVTPASLLSECFDGTPLPDAIAPSWKAPTSGGSTGRPKLILSGAPAVYSAAFGGVWRIHEADVSLLPGPLYHNAPFQMASVTLLRGGHLILMAKFDAEQTLREIHRHRVSWLCVVPTMMNRIDRLPASVRSQYDVKSLRTVWHVAAPCPAALKRSWIEWLGPDAIWEIYGATEGQAGCVISGSEWLQKPGSVGKVVIGQMKIVSADGQDLPPGEVGEIYLRPQPGSPPTYHYRGAQAVSLPDGWDTVGDLGSMDADGYVYLSDRRSDLILVGGANVYPAEVEAAIEQHADIQSCAVVGLPDDDMGQRVHAIIQSDRNCDLDGLRSFLEQRLARYKIPRSFEIVGFPLRDDAGKVRRSWLREERLHLKP